MLKSISVVVDIIVVRTADNYIYLHTFSSVIRFVSFFFREKQAYTSPTYTQFVRIECVECVNDFFFLLLLLREVQPSKPNRTLKHVWISGQYSKFRHFFHTHRKNKIWNKKVMNTFSIEMNVVISYRFINIVFLCCDRRTNCICHKHYFRSSPSIHQKNFEIRFRTTSHTTNVIKHRASGNFT